MDKLRQNLQAFNTRDTTSTKLKVFSQTSIKNFFLDLNMPVERSN